MESDTDIIKKKRKLSYVPEFNTGHLLTVVSMLASVIAAGAFFYAQAQIANLRITNLEATTSKIATTMDKLADAQSEMRVLMQEIRKERLNNRPRN
jgi:septal ring factor EnvC (AmiA/AmiB activator)